ncbi:MAG: prepilin-type N-terminal cleavage/methylation domain-containing protein [Armatimonadetes bacterium]|nr:prepilin-type N-terminal cleavage/methylation domain-containing protein [Armatimonadota bacterium]
MLKKSAFTLIELLVVIAIIAILAAILFPVFARAKESAKKTQALAQMRQMGLSVEMYATDNDDYLIPSTNYDSTNTDPDIWTPGLQPYVKNKQIFVAPGSSTSKYAEGWGNRQEQSVGYNGTTAIGTVAGGRLTAAQVCSNGELKVGCEGWATAATMNAMDRPAEVGLFAITPDGPVGTKYRGYVISPDNGTAYWNLPFTKLEQAVPLVSDRDLVAELGGSLAPGQMKPIYARYLADGKDAGQTPVVLGDMHAKTFSAASIRAGKVVWRFR